MTCDFSASCRRQRITSVDLLRESVDHPNISAVMTRGMRKADSKEGLALDLQQSRKEALKKLQNSQPSSQFLETGYHHVMHDFPWKMEELLVDTDMPDGDQQVEGANLFSPMSRRSRIVSDGSEDVFEPNPLPDMMMIEMEDDRNEENRRIQANYKWNLRRQKIENEFLRLRHLSINRSRAAGGGARLRHSVSFGDDLEIQLGKAGMSLRPLDSDEDEETAPMRRERSLTTGSNPTLSYARSVSMPNKDVEDRLRTHTLPAAKAPSLETHREFEEEEDEEEEEDDEEEGGGAMLGLPPKDVPNLSMDQLDQSWAETDNDEVD